MVVSLNLNLSCAQPGEVDFPNLTTARSLLTSVERFTRSDRTFIALEGLRRQLLEQRLCLLQIKRVEPFSEPAIRPGLAVLELAAASPDHASNLLHRGPFPRADDRAELLSRLTESLADKA